MSQGLIHRTRDGLDLVCRVQIDLGVETPYILCAPLVPRDEWGALVPKLHIETSILGEMHVILLSQMVALPLSELGPVVADFGALSEDIAAAVALLVSGF